MPLACSPPPPATEWRVALCGMGAAAAEFPLREDFDFKIPFLGVQRSVSWKAEPGRCTVSIHYGSTDTIPTFPNPPSDQVWILTADGKTIPMDGSSMFVGATTGLGPNAYSHIQVNPTTVRPAMLANAKTTERAAHNRQSYNSPCKDETKCGCCFMQWARQAAVRPDGLTLTHAHWRVRFRARAKATNKSQHMMGARP